MTYVGTGWSRSILVALHGLAGLKNSIAWLTWILVCTYHASSIRECS